MSIIFHCEHCGRKIEAQDKVSGKWGKCPSCHNKIYVPALNDNERLKLSPLDKNEEQKEKQLMDETHKLTESILQERDIPEETGSTNEPAEPAPAEMSEEDLTNNIISYLRNMADSRLAEAEIKLKTITTHGSEAKGILDDIAVSEMPDAELADIPPQVLAGLIRKLRNKIN